MEELELPEGAIAYWKEKLVDEINLIAPEGYTVEYAPLRGLEEIIINYQTNSELLIEFRTIAEVNENV